MLGSVYAKTLQDLRGQVLAWSAGLAVLAAANVLIFPSIQQMPGLQSFLDLVAMRLQCLGSGL